VDTAADKIRVGGLVLLGGRSTRMGYEKHRLRTPRGSMLEVALGQMRQVAGVLGVSMGARQQRPQLPHSVLAVPDARPDEGPLQGMVNGFQALRAQADVVLVMPVDMPFLDAGHMRRLLTCLEEDPALHACVYRHQGFVNALVGAYRTLLLPKMEGLLAAGKRRPVFVYEGEPTTILESGREGEAGADEAAHGHPLADMDTPQSYRDALLHMGVGTPGAAAVMVSPVLPAPLPEAPEGGRGMVSLYAGNAREVMEALRALYPELNAGGLPLGMQRITPSGAPENLPPEAPLEDGDMLCVARISP